MISLLIIARKVGEALRIGEGVVVAVQEIRGKRVRLAVTAPASVPIARAELAAEEPEQQRSYCSEESLPAFSGDPRGSQS